MIVNIAIIGRTNERTNEPLMSARASEIGMKNERPPECRGGPFTKKKNVEESVCLSGIMMAMAVLDPFLADLFMKENHSNIYYPTSTGRVSWKERTLTD